MDIILTHENADFDAVAALLAAFKLNPDALPVLPERLNRNVAHFLSHYQNQLPFVRQAAVRLKSVSRITLVDTQRAPQIKGIPASTPIKIIDHHPRSEVQEHQIFVGESVGAVTTLLVEQMRQQNLFLKSIEATLLALGIYEDTGSMTYGTTTPRDIQAAAWLVEQGAELDTIRPFLATPLSDEQKVLLDNLVKGVETRIIEGHTVIVASATLGHYVSEISSVAHRLRDMLDPAGLFILVQMPDVLQVVARSTDDAIDVGEIARVLGGGGHGRAAAASIHDKTLAQSIAVIWHELAEHVHSSTSVANLMSYGVHTVNSAEALKKIVRQLRRIGHEGYPVVENGQVVGLLLRRDLDRAIEHDLGHLTVRDIMLSGSVSLHPGDSVFTLEQRMLESGWGQIPIVDNMGQLIGIVTRTDLIKHWAQSHPPASVQGKTLSSEKIEAVLGKPTAQLINLIAVHAQEKDIQVYLVGGAVRDLLLDRPNFDIDFVVEGNAIEFARGLASQYGGHINAFPPFGTAKWSLEDSIATTWPVPLDKLPEHIDFASARNEFYEHPTALPTVYNSSIKLDLQRRDFTVNTLAFQLSPAHLFGQILNFYGGLADLEAGLLRVLHSLSFVDDPTRILRAVRFERRLSFAIESRTAELITIALPILGRITGERLRNELNLLFKEHEPEQGLLEHQQRGILKAIHPAFGVNENIVKPFRAAREGKFPWTVETLDLADLYWHILAAHFSGEQVESLAERLMVGQTLADSLLQAARLVKEIGFLTGLDTRPSQIAQKLAGSTELALLAAWLVIESPIARDRIALYWTKWQHIHPITNGNVLREIGLKPGPCYRIILERLRNAWLDDDVSDEVGERLLLQKLIRDEAICHDSP